MAIPSEYANRSLYHFTHINNLPEIVEHGALYSKNMKELLGIVNTNIANEEIQHIRSTMEVTCGPGGVVHDYVPLYFCKRSPMLSSLVYNKVVDERSIIYLEFPIQILEYYKSVFTSASANTKLNPKFYDTASELENLDWDCIATWAWRDGDVRKKKQAEAFVYKALPLNSLKNVIVYNQSMKKRVETLFTKHRISIPIIIGKDHGYYINNVNGPDLIYEKCMVTVESVIKNLGYNQFPKYDNLFNLRKSLREKFDCLPETSELIGLETENQKHSDDVGKHTCKVVSELLKTSEYEAMDDTDQLLVEIAAFLHDIGKGPKSRWRFNKGVQKIDPDHPLKALPMVQRVLTEDVGSMKARSAKVICKLVCYHDLVGDIVGKGRRIEELEKIVLDERELNMLIAIAKADMKSIEPSWVLKNENNIEKVRERILTKLSGLVNNN